MANSWKKNRWHTHSEKIEWVQVKIVRRASRKEAKGGKDGGRVKESSRMKEEYFLRPVESSHDNTDIWYDNVVDVMWWFHVEMQLNNVDKCWQSVVLIPVPLSLLFNVSVSFSLRPRSGYSPKPSRFSFLFLFPVWQRRNGAKNS